MRPHAPLIACRAISKTYNRKRGGITRALTEVNLQVETGDIFGIIGSSGAGKSTLLRCLATLERPSSGEIVFQGNDISRLSEDQLYPMRRQIGVIFQHFNLFSSRTVRGNISYPMEIGAIPKEEREKRIDTLVDLVGLKKEEWAYPAQLSGGQKQRVGIARALAGRPTLLLCDEATSALDPATTQEILGLIKEIQRKLGLTVILITHEMEVVKQICNKVAVLDQGKVVESGNLSTLFAYPKHPVTKSFVQKAIHEIPPQLTAGEGRLLHLHFRGEKANVPLISQMIKLYHVDANILLGWIDVLQGITIGNLIIELTGEKISDAITFLKTQEVIVEEIIKKGY